jgi:rubrerythrin
MVKRNNKYIRVTVKLNSMIMKKIVLAAFSCAFLFGNAVLGLGPLKTVDNLKAAFKGESTASAKYAAYAEQARKEGYASIGTLFDAASKAEAIHAANHKTVLEKMGQTVDPVKPEFTAKSTKENLADAISGETYEFTTMYKGFIETAKAENANDAVKSFTWATDTEKKHNLFYQKALDAINAGKVSTLSMVYYVCPKCGNTFDTSKPESKCSFCYTASSKYIKFGK